MVKPGPLFLILWGAFWTSWLVAALWRSNELRRAASPAVWTYRLLLVLGGFMLDAHASHLAGMPRLWRVGTTGAYALALAMVPGFAFAWWARVCLGRLWSSNVTLKPDHVVVRSGPYAVVRHPIYTGILFACLATGIAEATPAALAGVAVITAGLVVKARLEERFLAAELPPDAYAAYRRAVPMLLPLPRPSNTL